MLTRRCQMYREACALIAADRKGTPRDDGYHRWRVAQFDQLAVGLAAALNSISRTLDAFSKG